MRNCCLCSVPVCSTYVDSTIQSPIVSIAACLILLIALTKTMESIQTMPSDEELTKQLDQCIKDEITLCDSPEGHSKLQYVLVCVYQDKCIYIYIYVYIYGFIDLSICGNGDCHLTDHESVALFCFPFLLLFFVFVFVFVFVLVERIFFNIAIGESSCRTTFMATSTT